MTDTLVGAPDTSTQNVTGQDAFQLVMKNYPAEAWMLVIPELANTIDSIAQQGIVDPNEIQTMIEQTNWWKTQSDTVKNFIQLQQTDPAQFQYLQTQQTVAVQATLQQLGLNATQDQINQLAYASLFNGWSKQQLADTIGQAVQVQPNGTFVINPISQYGMGQTAAGTETAGSLEANLQQVQAIGKQFMVNLSPDVANQWAINIAQGTATVQGFQSYAQETALSSMPWMAAGIKAGQTPLQIINPYASMVANELGTSPDNIDWTQPQWAKLLSTSDPKTGGLVQTPIWQATQQLRSDPSYGWQNTKGAKDAAYSMVQGLAETLGIKSFGGTTPGTIATPAAFGSQGG